MQVMRIMNTFTMGSVGICESFIPNSVYTQCIRWKRKPIWLPTAKSKLFRVPKRPVIPTEDYKELKRLYNNYRTYMTSLRAYFRQIAIENEVQYDQTILKQNAEKDFQKCNAINDKWNAEVAKIREARLADMKEARNEHILQSIVKAEEQTQRYMQRIGKRIKQAEEEAPTFITAENVDTAIEQSLANIVNHNCALDLEGNWYDGKYPAEPALEDTKEPTVTQQ